MTEVPICPLPVEILSRIVNTLDSTYDHRTLSSFAQACHQFKVLAEPYLSRHAYIADELDVERYLSGLAHLPRDDTYGPLTQQATLSKAYFKRLQRYNTLTLRHFPSRDDSYEINRLAAHPDVESIFSSVKTLRITSSAFAQLNIPQGDYHGDSVRDLSIARLSSFYRLARPQRICVKLDDNLGCNSTVARIVLAIIKASAPSVELYCHGLPSHIDMCVLTRCTFAKANLLPPVDSVVRRAIRSDSPLVSCDCRGFDLEAYWSESTLSWICKSAKGTLNTADEVVFDDGSTSAEASYNGDGSDSDEDSESDGYGSDDEVVVVTEQKIAQFGKSNGMVFGKPLDPCPCCGRL